MQLPLSNDHKTDKDTFVHKFFSLLFCFLEIVVFFYFSVKNEHIRNGFMDTRLYTKHLFKYFI